MSESSKENPSKHTSEAERDVVFSLMDFRAGHWPETKTPPWLFNEMGAMKHPEWKIKIEKQGWDKGQEIFVGSGRIDIDGDIHDVDVYALPPLDGSGDYISFAAYPSGKSHSDFWDEAGERIEADEEESE